MQVVVTGSEGFLGRRLVSRLQDLGHNVEGFDIVGPDPMSVTDQGFVDEACQINPDAIVHLAGPVADTAKHDPIGSLKLQVLGTANVIEVAAETSARLLLASSFYVYDGIDPGLMVNEETALSPSDMDMFGFAKYTAERMISDSKQVKEWLALRFGSMYGGEGGSNVIDDFLWAGRNGGDLVMWGAGTRKNQYTHVEDVANAVAELCQDSWSGRSVNLISPEVHSVGEVVELLCDRYGFRSSRDLTRPEGKSMPYMSAWWAKQHLSWNPRTLEDGL